MTTDASEYLVNHGAGGVGRFTAAAAYRRGERVVIESRRGLELGVVLCPATERHARALAGPIVGRLLRHVGAADELLSQHLRERSRQLFEVCRRTAATLGLPFEILDVELLLDGRGVVVQHLRWAECDYAPFVEFLAHQHGLDVWMEDLALPLEPPEVDGCGKPGCGQSAGGCSDCGSGGGCGTCAKGEPLDLRDYFAHLRTRMEQPSRVPLL